MQKSICRAGGFTLIELMVVVAVIAILASVGYPSYTEYVQRSKISEATATLSDWRIRMERYYQDNRTYLNGANCGAATPSNDTFSYSCASVAADTFRIQATGLAARGMNGFTFDVDQANLRRTTAFPGVSGTQNCWMTRRGDAC